MFSYKVDIEISKHAKERSNTYHLTEKIIIEAVKNPDETTKGYGGTLIAHKSLNE